MILADKIINERKKNGWSQEDLADQLGVSRQSVSKWEGAQSIPDLQKIVKMAEIFGVTTDYLLKDEIEADEVSEHVVEAKDVDPENKVRKVSMEEANEFMEFKSRTRKTIANGVSLCILSPVVLIFMSAMSDKFPEKISENLGAGIGLLFLFGMIITAVAMFIKHGSVGQRFEYIEREPIETAYGVSGVVKEKKKAYESTHTSMTVIGVVMLIACAIPTVICGLLEVEDYITVCSVVVLLAMVACGVNILIRTSSIWESYNALLEENEFSKKNKDENDPEKAVMGIYWTLVTAIYLGWSFITKNWQYTWIVWMIAGVLCPAIKNIVRLSTGKKK